MEGIDAMFKNVNLATLGNARSDQLVKLLRAVDLQCQSYVMMTPENSNWFASPRASDAAPGSVKRVSGGEVI
jgi:hypothetical protein